MVRFRVARAALLLVVLMLAAPLLAACSGDADPAVGGEDAAGLRSFEAPDFARRMSRPGTVLLDVRTPGEFREGHVDGARNINIDAANFEERIESLDPDGTYAIYCRDGERSSRAARLMAEHGMPRVYDLDGGMRAWMAYGGAITRE